MCTRDDHSAPRAEILDLANRLSNSHGQRRSAALTALTEVGPNTVRVLAKETEVQLTRWLANRPTSSILTGTSLGLLAFATLSTSWHPVWRRILMLAIDVTCFVPLYTYLISVVIRPPRAYQTAVTALAEIGDASTLEQIAMATKFGDRSSRSSARAALIRILPSISSRDAEHLQSRQRDILYEFMYGDDRPLIFAILSSLPAFEDIRALPHVSRLSSGAGIAKDDSSIRELAIHVALVLRAHRDRIQSDRTLVRAGSSAGTEQLTGLRASRLEVDDEPQKLLRADGRSKLDSSG